MGRALKKKAAEFDGVKISIDLDFFEYQNLIFNDPARFKCIPKGRRCGFTHGVAIHVVDLLVENITNECYRLLWVDTIQGNIDKYFDRYFRPQLEKLPKKLWHYNKQAKELKVGTALLDFRSAERPESIEGFSYHGAVLNEAGIILQNRYLWENAIRPMLMDFNGWAIIGGTPKGKTSKRDKQEHLFYELSKRGQSGAPSIYKSWKTWRVFTHDNPLLDDAEIEETIQTSPAAVRDQEIYGKFQDSNEELVFKKEWFNKVPRDWTPSKWLLKIQSWDTALKDGEENDFSCGISAYICENGFYIVGAKRGQWNYPTLKREFLEFYDEFEPDLVIVEDKASGISLIQDLKESTRIPIRAIQVDKNKMARANAASPSVEGGNVYIQEGKEFTQWLINAITSFPDFGRDETDAFTQIINEFKGKLIAGADNIAAAIRTRADLEEKPRKENKRGSRRSKITDGY